MKFLLPALLGLATTANAGFLFGNKNKAWDNTFKQFSSLDYQSKTADAKMDQLWSQISATTTPANWYNAFELLGLFVEDMSITGSLESDVMPPSRKKLIHSADGGVAKVSFVAEPNSPYTGVFQGCDNVVMRISPAKQPDATNPKAMNNFVPAMGVKFLRDGVPSANIIFMRSVNGQEDWNPFSQLWSNHIPQPVGLALKAVAAKFQTASKYGTRIGVSAFGEYDQKGKKTVGANKFPFRLVVQPTDAVNKLFPATYQDVIYKQLQTIPAGTTLYNLIAFETPDSQPVKIGTFVMKTKFQASSFADKMMFMQHIFAEEDLKIHPEWEPAMANPYPVGNDKMAGLNVTGLGN